MVRLPKIVGDVWFNTRPLTAEDLAGKVALIDFWTYSCVNCQRTLPYLRDWWQKYKDKGLVIIGVHTPEFEFEKNPANVKQAMADLGVAWPVVLDSDYINWNNFANRYWPAKYLADQEGRIVYTHFGEGAYAETEAQIQNLLKAGGMQDIPEIDTGEHGHGNVCFIPTPELYCGYERGYISNTEGYRYDQTAEYTKPEKIDKDSIALTGAFLARPEYLESVNAGSTLLLSFRATEANLVLHPVGERAKVRLALDGKSLAADIRGHDAADDGTVSIEKPTLYNLLKSDHLIEGILEIRADQGKFQAYAFTFSGCTD